MSTKWLIGGLGFVMGGPIGGLIGWIVGSMIDAATTALPSDSDEEAGAFTTQGHTSDKRRKATIGDIRVSIVVLIACVIKADGQVLKSEVNYVKPFLLRNFGEEGAKDALHLLKELLARDIDSVAVAQQIGQNVNHSTCLELIHMLIDLAYADGEMVSAEQSVIEQIAANMRIQPQELNALFALYRRQQDPDWAYNALEITSSATNDEVKHAYRRMAMKYHPDKVANAGEEIRQQATAKFRAINEAYEQIKKQRGMA